MRMVVAEAGQWFAVVTAASLVVSSGGCLADVGEGRARTAAPAETTEARALVESLRQRFRSGGREDAGAAWSLLRTPELVGVDIDGTWLRPRLSGAAVGTQRPGRVELPTRADGPFRLRDELSGLSVEVGLEGAIARSAELADGLLVYRRAYPGGADLIHRVTTEGTEDFLVFEEAPVDHSVGYDLALGDRVAGLRLVANTLEMLDAGGVPRLRVAPPYLVDARGRRHPASLAVEGCAVDTDPAGPWGRAVTAPGASACSVLVSWEPEPVEWPAVLDPAWWTTGSMAVGRASHEAAVLADGRVLVAGGAGIEGLLASVELYDMLSGTWAATGSLRVGRAEHTASALQDGRVLVAGGTTANEDPTPRADLYDPESGTWADTAEMSAARSDFTASVLEDGRVLVVSGKDWPGSVISSELYDPVSETWELTGDSIAGRYGHAAVVLEDGRVLVCGGGSGSVFEGGHESAEIYDPASGAWSAAASMSEGRAWLSAVRLADGRVLASGGRDATRFSFWTTAGAEIYDPEADSWASVASMSANRSGHTSTLLEDGRALIVGDIGADFSEVELYDAGSDAWTVGPNMNIARRSPTASLLPGGGVLVAGGLTEDGSIATGSAELFLCLDEDADADGDGAPCALDCDDTNAERYPGAPDGCDGADTDCAGNAADELDQDGDGWRPCGGDCDDFRAAAFPGAEEICDGIDNACAGAAPAEEADNDGDGWRPCSGDCDDEDPAVFPDGCDGIDNDCSGIVPAEEADHDGDGWRLCAGDCDDDDDERSPDADEICDGIDNDCSGAVPDDELDRDRDGWMPCAGDCDDEDATVSPAAEDVCNGRDDDCDGTVDPTCDEVTAAGGGCSCRTPGGEASGPWLWAVATALGLRRFRARTSRQS